MDGFSLVDSPRPAAENMAIDQQMLEQAARQERVLLRVYQWSEPSLSLGYFQKYADRQAHAESRGIAVVRRATGGGAIVHHHDWTYSIAVPQGLLESSLGASQPLYDGIHDAVVDWLAELGLKGAKWSAPTCRTPGQACPFLCFERRSQGDVVVGNAKVLGSAQRRRQGAVLQHGSLLLARSQFAPSLAGIRELRNSAPQESARAKPPQQESPGKSENEWASPEFTVDEFIQRLAKKLNVQLGIRMHAVDQLTELVPSQWDTRPFSETSWTQRI